jgi:hypothetical protein
MKSEEIEHRADMPPEKPLPFRIKEQKGQSKRIPATSLMVGGKPAKQLPDKEKV